MGEQNHRSGAGPKEPAAGTSPMTGSRLAKVMARHGLCSRRQAERWIVDGRVRVNDKLIRTPAFNVVESDVIEVDGTPIAERRGTRVWLYHKPAGLVVTERDPEGRPTVFEEFARRGLPRVLTIGRLDINTEGLLMLTNDGGLKRTLELPATGWLRRYRVRAHGRITQDRLDELKNGISVDGVRYGPIEATLEREQGANVWITIALKEGKNREIKNVLAALGLQVNRLIRTSFGPFQLGDIPVGAIDTVKARVLRDQLGQKLARKAGVDFSAPMPDPLVSAPADPSRKGRAGTRKKPGAVSAEQREQDHNASSRSRSRTAQTAGARRKDTRRHPEQGRKAKTEGRFSPSRHVSKEEPETSELKKVHFSGGRPAEMFEPQAGKKKGPGRSGGPGAGGRSRRSGPERSGRLGGAGGRRKKGPAPSRSR